MFTKKFTHFTQNVVDSLKYSKKFLSCRNSLTNDFLLFFWHFVEINEDLLYCIGGAHTLITPSSSIVILVKYSTVYVLGLRANWLPPVCTIYRLLWQDPTQDQQKNVWRKNFHFDKIFIIYTLISISKILIFYFSKSVICCCRYNAIIVYG